MLKNIMNQYLIYTFHPFGMTKFMRKVIQDLELGGTMLATCNLFLGKLMDVMRFIALIMLIVITFRFLF